MNIALPIIALVAGLVIGYLIASSLKSRAEARAEMLEKQNLDQQHNHERVLADLMKHHENRIAEMKDDYEKQIADAKKDYKEQLANQKEHIEHELDLISEKLKTSSEEALKRRSEELSSVNKEQIEKFLNPLQTGLQQMKDEVEKNRQEHDKTMIALTTSIKESMAQTKEIGERADSLARTLSHENKIQGNFGELCLRKMLEDMGFERGKHFTEQTTLRDEAGRPLRAEDSDKKMQPDIILHFPDKRDIIIDSKVSLTAFERYANAKNDQEKQQALKDHVASVRNQVKLLKQKSYWKQYNQNGVKLDFVVMYIFSESALQLAVTSDPALWHEAYDQGVLITSSQNLYALLRILDISWKHMAQVENQQNIITCANEIVSRVQLFYERLLNLEKEFQIVENSFKDLKTVTAPTGKSIMTSARKLLDYGATENPKRKSLRKDEIPTLANNTTED